MMDLQLALVLESGGGGFMAFLPFLLIIAVIYFFMIRPQSKKAKDQQKFRAEVQKGDKIVTIGGIHGKIADTKDTTLLLDIGNNQRLTIEKSAVSMEATQAAYGGDQK
jgi:preprotein translocase subunit YajC